MSFAGRLRERLIWQEVEKHRIFYSDCTSRTERMELQLRLFNEQWRHVRTRVPFYNDLARHTKLPEVFGSWEEVITSLPVMNRTIIQDQQDRLYDPSRPPQWWRMTGGSTAQPVQLPAWKSEKRFLVANTWLGRYWYGVRPSDRLFLIWGHSHTLGSGLKGKMTRYKRILLDFLLQYYRCSAYNMNEESMRLAAEALLAFRPAYVIAYSVALDAFARYNYAAASELNRLRLKMVVGTAESFPFPNSQAKIADVFNAPVAMEYGSVETGVIAHTDPTGGYKVFWRSYFLEALERGPGGGRILRITALYPRCFPLLRYELGDEIQLDNDKNGLALERFSRVVGRCNDYLLLPDGSCIHSELITHSLREFKEVTGYQVIQSKSETTLNVTTKFAFSRKLTEQIRTKLALVHPYLRTVIVQPVQVLQQTGAGKTPVVIRSARGLSKTSGYSERD